MGKSTYTCCSCELRFLASENLSAKQRTENGIKCLLCISLETPMAKIVKKKGPARKESKRKKAISKVATPRTAFKRGGDDAAYVPPSDGGKW